MGAFGGRFSFPWACRGPVARGEKAPRPAAAAVMPSVSDGPAKCIVHSEIGRHLSDLLHDATRECERCGLPMTPGAEARGRGTLECANRHRHEAPLPRDRAAREPGPNWNARRGAQVR